MLVEDPLPDRCAKDTFYEDTMMLLEIVKEKKNKENRCKKVKSRIEQIKSIPVRYIYQEEQIRAMAMEQKLKNQMWLTLRGTLYMLCFD